MLYRYLPPGSVRLGATVNFHSQNLYTTVFMNPSSDVVIVLMNSNNFYIDMNITDNGRTMIPRYEKVRKEKVHLILIKKITEFLHMGY